MLFLKILVFELGAHITAHQMLTCVEQEWNFPKIHSYTYLKRLSSCLVFVRTESTNFQYVIKARPDIWHSGVFWPGKATAHAYDVGLSLNFIQNKLGLGWSHAHNNIITITRYVNVFTSRKSLNRRSQSAEDIASLLAGIHKSLRNIPAGENYSFLSYPLSSKSKALEGLEASICQSLGSSARSAFEYGKYVHECSKPELHWVHGDFRPQNIGYQTEGKRLIAIDFDNTSFFSRAYEVARGYLCCTSQIRPAHLRSEFDRFVNSYNQAYYLSSDAREILCHYLYVAICSIASRKQITNTLSEYDKIVYHRCNLALYAIE
ncbi:phosphotransferase [Pseudomonas sp. 25 E 4]|uniref:phosphotransferase n=1 Tax=Pseudomonas sp. 25 E 4 TaxID=1844097 RepID=UPI001146930D|nr:phosphotransferase [Pseudomonas sp. 25 E 4]